MFENVKDSAYPPGYCLKPKVGQKAKEKDLSLTNVCGKADDAACSMVSKPKNHYKVGEEARKRSFRYTNVCGKADDAALFADLTSF